MRAASFTDGRAAGKPQLSYLTPLARRADWDVGIPSDDLGVAAFQPMNSMLHLTESTEVRDGGFFCHVAKEGLVRPLPPLPLHLHLLPPHHLLLHNHKHHH